MSSLTEIRAAIGETIEANIPRLRVYHRIPETSWEMPAVLVLPDRSNFEGAFARGMDEWFFELYVLVEWVEATRAQDALDSYINGFGPNSIREVIFNNDDLGLDDSIAHISGVARYGAKFDTQINHVGAVLTLCVRTSGNS